MSKMFPPYLCVLQLIPSELGGPHKGKLVPDGKYWKWIYGQKPLPRPLKDFISNFVEETCPKCEVKRSDPSKCKHAGKYMGKWARRSEH